MSTRGAVLIGGPDTGKTNFVGGLWLALQRGDGVLIANGLPERIDYVEQIVAHLHQGSFAPRTDQNTDSADSRVPKQAIEVAGVERNPPKCFTER